MENEQINNPIHAIPGTKIIIKKGFAINTHEMPNGDIVILITDNKDRNENINGSS